MARSPQVPGLFENEEAAIAAAQSVLDAAEQQDNPVLPALGQLLTRYKKLYKQIRHLIRISDRQQQRLSEVNDALEQRNRFIRETFGRFTSDEVVESILASPEGVNLGGEKRHITILMADLRGFTATSERLPAEDVLGIVNIFLEVMTDVILERGGTILEFIGDAILAIFGAPVARADHAERAVACAVQMQQAMQQVNERNRAAGYPRVAMGVGINTGDVVVGNIGSRKRMKYGVTGRHINLASRIESYTVGGQILIAPATAEACSAGLRIDQRLEIGVKGMERPIRVLDLGGIGAPYNLHVPREAQERRCLLEPPIGVRVQRLAGKHQEAPMETGDLLQLWHTGGRLRSAEPMAQLDNLRLVLLDRFGERLPGDIYAKVTDPLPEAVGEVIVTFTSLPTEAAAVIQFAIGQGCRSR